MTVTSSHSRENSPDGTDSPSTPLSPSGLPQWLRTGRARSRYHTKNRLKLASLTFACLFLGWLFASAASRGGRTQNIRFEQTAVSQSGTHNEPTVPHPSETLSSAGSQSTSTRKTPSVSGALSDLHHALGDKLHSWNPYSSKPALAHSSANTTEAISSKPEWSDGEDVKDGSSEHSRLGARTRVGKCTILFNGNTYWERAIRTHERHDRIHGYRLHILRHSIMDTVWSKPAYILSLLLRELAKPESDRLDWLFWVDADTIILNPNIPIETLLPPLEPIFDDIHLLYSTDWNGLNNGIFPIRVTQWSVDLFSAIVSYRYYRPTADLTFRDQSAMATLLSEHKFSSHAVQAPQRWFNAYQGEHNETLAPFQIRRGDLLVHFAGVPNREERMGYWLDRAEQQLDDWEIPLKSTSYPAEARDFWREEGEKRKAWKEEMEKVHVETAELMAGNEALFREFGERLGPAAKDEIANKGQDLADVLRDRSKWEGDRGVLDAARKAYEVACEPLRNLVDGARRVLLKAAHEAIFVADRTAVEARGKKGIAESLIEVVERRVNSLKTLLMVPDEGWRKEEVVAATNGVTDARGQLQGEIDRVRGEASSKAVVMQQQTRVVATTSAASQSVVVASSVLTANVSSTTG